MFDIGFWEIVMIGVVGLVVIGPERLPDVARTLGKWVGRTRRFINQVKSDVSAELKQEELRKAIENNADLNELKQIMNTEHFTLEDEEEDYSEPDYKIKAIDDEPAAETQTTETSTDTTSTRQEPQQEHNDADIDFEKEFDAAIAEEEKLHKQQAVEAEQDVTSTETQKAPDNKNKTPVDHEHKA